MKAFKFTDRYISKLPVADYKVSTGTTIVAAVSKDAVVLCADLQATLGTVLKFNMYTQNQTKMRFVSKHVAFLLAGQAALINYFESFFKQFIATYERQTSDVATPAIVAHNLAFLLSRNPSNAFVMIIAGWNVVQQKPQIFEIFGDGYISEKQFAANGSGMIVATGALLSNYYKLGRKSIEQVTELVQNAVFAAATADVFSGFGITTAYINKQGASTIAYREISKDITKQNF